MRPIDATGKTRAGPIGLDNRPRPATMRGRILRGLAQSPPLSSLQRRIIFFNLVGLALMGAGVLYLNQFRSGLIEQRLTNLRVLSEVIAVSLSEDLARPGDDGVMDADRAQRFLSRAVAPTGLRARLFDTDPTMTFDTGPTLPAAGRASSTGVLDRFLTWLERFYGDTAAGTDPLAGPVTAAGPFNLGPALAGRSTSHVSRNERGESIVSVGQPIMSGTDTQGVLLLSTEGGDIDRIVRAERASILRVFVLAALVSVALSILLANTIARPIKRLAAATSHPGGNSGANPNGAERVQIPDMTMRSDEIGDLAMALSQMTDALYDRIEANESFAADVSHEIKNPLTSLRSAVETMDYARTPEQRQRLLDVIEADVGRMDRLVTDIANASRLDADLVRERMASFDLAELVKGLGEVFAEQAARMGLTLEIDLPDGPAISRGLEGRIAQVISNFLENALSFSPSGGRIRLAIRRLPDGWEVSVSDEGPGIPPENLGSVFERFYTERPEAQGFGNHSGLGLAISRQIVEAHGGRIRAENIAGPDGSAGARGARFTFDLPDR